MQDKKYSSSSSTGSFAIVGNSDFFSDGSSTYTSGMGIAGNSGASSGGSGSGRSTLVSLGSQVVEATRVWKAQYFWQWRCGL
ncbi:hypothetical protein E2542_SST00233 [Spatholobus suberectus]|nr:hypothetical protein E2542_SST00233 [Spatholobus suberectus]